MESKTGKIVTKKKKFSLKRLLKRTALGFVIFLGLIIGALIAIPYFFKDEILTKVQEEINKNVNAEVSFEDVGLSLFRSFPDFSLRLKGLEVMGNDEFEGLRLAGIKNFDVTLDIMSVIKSDRPIQVQSISLDEPNLYVKVLKNGKANYDIAIPSTDTTTVVEEEETTTEESTDFTIQLKSYSIKNGNVTYDDNTMPILAEIKNLNHSGKGDLTSMIYDLKTKTTADALSVNFDGVQYLANVDTKLDLDISVDMENMKFTIQKNKTIMNALELNMEGFVAMPGDDIDMDLKLGSPSTNFKDLLSMIPAAYTADFKGVDASGAMTINGVLKGLMTETAMPTFNFNIGVDNANFRYPDLPMGINNFNTKVNINSPTSNLDDMVVNIPNFHVEVDKSPFDAKFLLKNPMTDPYVEAFTKGTIILEDLAKAFPLKEQGIEELKGTIKANLDTKTRMSFVTDEKYDLVDMKGDLEITNMDYLGEGMPKVTIKEMKMAFTPQNVILDNFDAKLGSSDLQMSGTLDNILTYFSGTKTMKGVLKVRSNKFDGNEWITSEEEATVESTNAPTVQIEDTTTVAGETEIFDKFDFTLDAEFKDITYDIYHIKNTVGKGHFTPAHMEFEQLSTQMGKSDFYVQGDLQNVFGYLFNNETLRGNAFLRSELIDADELMAMTMPPSGDDKGQNSDDAPDVSNPLPIKTTDEELFGKFDVNADVSIDKLKYDVYEMTNLAGIGNFKHDVFQVSNFGLNIGQSDMKVTGRIENAIDWLFYSEQEIKGVIDLTSNFLDVNQFMVETPETTVSPSTPPPAEPTPPEDLEPFLVPADMDFIINTHLKKVFYDKMNLKNVSGALVLQEEAVNMSDLKANVFGGQMKLTGGYDTKNPEKPKFDFSMDINDFLFNDAFNTLNMVQKIAPIGKYIEGKFNTTLTLNGILGKDMMPDFKTLNSNGLLETLDAAIKDFKPTSELASKLNMDELKTLEIKNSKNFFEIKNGFVSVKPFDLKLKDIQMNIGGKHGIDQDMDYDIKMIIPRKMLEGNKATAAVNTGIDLLSGQASKLGLNLKQGENINVLVNMTGNISKPKINVKLLGMDGSSVSDDVKDAVGDEVDKIKENAQAKADSLKKVAEQKFQEEEDKFRALAQAKADSLKNAAVKKVEDETKKVVDDVKKKADDEIKKVTDKVGDEAKKKIEDEVGKATDKIDEDLKKKAQEELDKLKNKFKNPFKKKKKDN